MAIRDDTRQRQERVIDEALAGLRSRWLQAVDAERYGRLGVAAVFEAGVLQEYRFTDEEPIRPQTTD